MSCAQSLLAMVIADHDGKSLKQETHGTVAAARQMVGSEGEIHVIVIGASIGSIVEAARRIGGVDKVVAAESAEYHHRLPEDLTGPLVRLAENYTHVLAPANAMGKSLLPRVAALLDVAQISDISSVKSADEFVRPIHAGSLLSTVRSKDVKKVVTIRSSAFSALAVREVAAPVERFELPEPKSLSTLLSEDATLSERPDLATARVVVAGGRGLKSRENFALLDRLAHRLGGAVGASRAAVDAEFVPNDYQVGQTGKVVAPDLYIAVGISGAVQHIAGMKDSKVIVAINSDAEAPIFKVADYGIVDDLFKVIPEIELSLDRLANEQ